MKNILSVFVLCALLVAFLFRAVPSKSQEDTFTRRDMLENIANSIILPIHLEFLNETTAFQEAAYRFRDDPSLETLMQLQQAWRSTSFVWEKVSVFQLGQKTLVYHSQVDNGTLVAIDAIDEVLAGSDVIDAAYVAGSGSNVKGLRTLEYLLFVADQDNESVLARYTTDPYAERRMQYLVATVDVLNLTALDIWNIWSPDGDDYITEFIESDDGSSIQESISMMTNMMLYSLEFVVQMNIGIALGGNLGRVDPAFVNAPYSGYSLEQMRSIMETIQQTFTGDGVIDGNHIGFDDYLDFLGATHDDQTLSSAIIAQLGVFIDMLSSLDHDALIQDPSLIQPLYQQGVPLIVLMKTEMASWMGITITFTDNDSD